MKRLLLAVLLLLLPSVAWADTQVHATDCPGTFACTAAKNGQECFEQDNDTLYICDGSVPGWVVGGSGTGSGTFADDDATPDVSGSSYWLSHSDTGDVITGFDYGGATPVPAGIVFRVQTVPSKLTYDCTNSDLLCGTGNVETENDEITVWIGTGGKAELIGLKKKDQHHGLIYVGESNPRFYATTYARGIQLDGRLQLGQVRYFDKSDTTPSVGTGTFFYGWDCPNNFSAHCVDLYDSDVGSPCGENEAQCTGNPDTFCDHNGIDLTTDAPQRVGAADSVCDSDATTTAAGEPANTAVTITDFDDGVDGQYIKIVTKDDITYDCAQASLQCNDGAALATQEFDVTSWVYNAVTDDWHLNGLEDNSSSGALKAALTTDNTLSGVNAFTSDASFAGTTTFRGGVIGDNSGTTWSVGILGRAEFLDYVRADHFETCTLGGCNNNIVMGGGGEDFFSVFTATGNVIIDGTLELPELASVTPQFGAGYGTFWVKSDAPTTPWFQDDTAADHPLAMLTGGTYTGDLIFNDNINATFGTGSDSTISYDGTNLLIDPQVAGSGYTDFTDAIFVAEDEDVYSKFGDVPVGLSPNDTADRLVAWKTRTSGTTGNRRALLAVVEVEGDLALANSAGHYGANTFAYTGETRTVSSGKTTNGGALVGNRSAARHEAAGTIAMAGGVAASATIQGADEDGVISEGYGFLDEGGDGGAGTGEISAYYGVWIKEATGNVIDKIGIYIEDQGGATNSNIGIQIDGADDASLWIGAGVDGTAPGDGILFGKTAATSANLYRGAADQLKTDDDFLLNTTKLLFNDSGTGIYSQGDSYLDLFADGEVRIGNSAAGAPTTYLTVESDADTFWVGDGTGIPYGSTYGNDIAWVQAAAVQNTWYNISDADMNSTVTNLVTGDGSGELTVAKAGRYKIEYSLSVASDTVNVHIESGIELDGSGTAGVPGQSHYEIANVAALADSDLPLSSVAILDLAASTTIEVAVRTTSAGAPDLTVDHLNIVVTMVGGT